METGEEIWMRYSGAKLPALVTVPRKERDFLAVQGLGFATFSAGLVFKGSTPWLIPHVAP